jgi:hypothetical protein
MVISYLSNKILYLWSYRSDFDISFVLLVHKKISRGGLIEIPVRNSSLLYTKHDTAIMFSYTTLRTEMYLEVRTTQEIIRPYNICLKHFSILQVFD